MRGLQAAIDGVRAPGLGLPTWGYLFLWSPIAQPNTGLADARLIEGWFHSPRGIAKLSNPERCAALTRSFRGLPMGEAPFVLFDVAPIVGADALYFGFARGPMAAGASLIELRADGLVQVAGLWRA